MAARDRRRAGFALTENSPFQLTAGSEAAEGGGEVCGLGLGFAATRCGGADGGAGGAAAAASRAAFSAAIAANSCCFAAA